MELQPQSPTAAKLKSDVAAWMLEILAIDKNKRMDDDNMPINELIDKILVFIGFFH